jgi:putative transposase
MVQNKWGFSPGGISGDMRLAPQELRTYFTSFSTSGLRRLFQVDEKAQLMVDTLQGYRAKGSFALHAFVVMPDHVHVLLTPAADVSLEKAIQLMKGGFSFRLKSKLDVWERGHFDRRIKDREGYDACVGYIHANLVKEHITVTVEEFAFSSAHPSAAVDPMPHWLHATRG